MLTQFKPTYAKSTKNFIQQLYFNQHLTLSPNPPHPPNPPTNPQPLITPFPPLQSNRAAPQQQHRWQKGLDESFCKTVAWHLIKKRKSKKERQEKLKIEIKKLERLQLVVGSLRELVNSKQYDHLKRAPTVLTSSDIHPHIPNQLKIYPYYHYTISPSKIASQFSSKRNIFKRQFIKKTFHHFYQDETDLHTVVKIKTLKKWLLQFLKPQASLDKLHVTCGIKHFQSLNLYLYLDGILSLQDLMVDKKLDLDCCRADIDHYIGKLKQKIDERFIGAEQTYLNVRQIKSMLADGSMQDEEDMQQQHHSIQLNSED